MMRPDDETDMALSIDTTEADELAHSLARLTGESMTEAVIVALRERLARERARRALHNTGFFGPPRPRLLLARSLESRH